MRVEFEPELFNRTLLSAGLTEQQVRQLEVEFTKNDFVIEDEVLLDHLLHCGVDLSRIIMIFSKLGLGKTTAVSMIEMKQKKNLGKLVEIYNLEVEL